MSVLKCKICGGQVEVISDSGIAICEYCGTRQALPLFTEESERLLYESGNNYLSHSEYDKAENVFNQLLTIKPGAAELYWDLVLCKFGVTYVKDPKTDKYIPTCNRTHYTSIFSDENYKKAISLSSGEKKELFEADAQTIDNIQKGIIEVSKKEKPFDIFISYKETAANGRRTKDSIEAQKLYEKLTEAGYKVFFSRITLEDKIGTEYEPYIYAALYSSKVMLTVCSSKENIEAVWVKNEWSRFLGFRQNDSSKTLIPLYFGMDRADLPDEFALLSSHDMSADGFIEELLRGIKKIIPLPIMKAKRRKQRIKAAVISAACFCAAIIALTAFFLPQKIKQQTFDSDYAQAIALFENADYEGAAKIFAELGDYKDAAQMVEKCTIQPKYDAAMQLYYDGNYAEATWAFDALGDYEDSAEQKEKSELSWRKSLATVITSNTLSYNPTTYYITPNGTVGTLSSASGDLHKNISISNHGKVISIESDLLENLYALHEDGYVSNAKEINGLSDDSEWHDIIKISCKFYDTNVALRSDGKMVCGNTDSAWSKELLKWENIVDFTYIAHGDPNNDAREVATFVIVGIKSDGSLCSVTATTRDYDFVNDINYKTHLNSKTKEIIESFKNVKSFILDYTVNSEGAIAVDKYNNLCIYKDGIMTTEKGDFSRVYDSRFAVKKNGDLYDVSNKRTISYNIVNSQKSYFITRNGKLYKINYGADNEACEEKIIVYDEWITELN